MYGDGPGPYVFQHEAELGIVTKGPSKSVSRDNWRQAVFGYTGMIPCLCPPRRSLYVALRQLDGQELRHLRAGRPLH